jgi:hypothetical protein
MPKIVEQAKPPEKYFVILIGAGMVEFEDKQAAEGYLSGYLAKEPNTIFDIVKGRKVQLKIKKTFEISEV